MRCIHTNSPTLSRRPPLQKDVEINVKPQTNETFMKITVNIGLNISRGESEKGLSIYK